METESYMETLARAAANALTRNPLDGVPVDPMPGCEGGPS